MSESKNRLDENKEREKIPNSFRGYKVLKEIGNGSFARVFKVEDDVTKEIYAAKVIPKKEFNSYEETEIEILQHISHPYIIKMYEVFEIATSNNDEYIVIIMEYCENDSLYDYIKKNNGFKKEQEKREMFRKILEAVAYLHEEDIAHCDIKLENILLDKNMNPKLCDFNLAIIYTKGLRRIGRGTQMYRAPEIIERKIIKDLTKIDIWSLAVTFYTASETYFPFNESEKPDPHKLSAKTKDSFLLLLLKKCFVLDPVHRISAKKMLDDEYFMNPVFPCSLNSLEESQNANIRNNRIAVNKYNKRNMKKLKNKERRMYKEKLNQVTASTDYQNYPLTFSEIFVSETKFGMKEDLNEAFYENQEREEIMKNNAKRGKSNKNKNKIKCRKEKLYCQITYNDY